MEFLRHDEKPSTSHSPVAFPLSSSSSAVPRLASSPHQSRLHPRLSYTRPRSLRISNLLRLWFPIITYVATTLAFLVAIALYRDQLFRFLDELSRWLRADEMYGRAVMFVLIFITTFPPIPLYSTLIILSGYTFGPWTGAVISYFAALSGALAVFTISRALLRDSISRWLSSYTSIKRVVRAIEKRPKLLFLIRLAPYPYNVMNCLLAAAPSLTLRTYTVCTALSLFKVIIHTSLGASINSFKDYHRRPHRKSRGRGGAGTVARMWTTLGILLCILIFVYLSIVARKAVDDELGDEEDSEETVAFLSPQARNDCEALGDPVDDDELAMAESPFRTVQQISSP